MKYLFLLLLLVSCGKNNDSQEMGVPVISCHLAMSIEPVYPYEEIIICDNAAVNIKKSLGVDNIILKNISTVAGSGSEYKTYRIDAIIKNANTNEHWRVTFYQLSTDLSRILVFKKELIGFSY